LPPDKQKVISVSDVFETYLTSDDFLFICCDGIFESFTNEDALQFIHDHLKKTNDLAEILSELLSEVLKKGSKDNMSAMIIELKNGEDYSAPDEFIPGKWYNIGNETFQQGYETDCNRRGQNYQEIKAKMMAKAANEKIEDETKTPRSPRRISEEKSESELEKERPVIVNTKQRNGSQSSRLLAASERPEKIKKETTTTITTTTTTTSTPSKLEKSDKSSPTGKSEKSEKSSDKLDKSEKSEKSEKDRERKKEHSRKKTVRAHSVKSSQDPKSPTKAGAKTASQPVKSEKTSAKKDKKK